MVFQPLIDITSLQMLIAVAQLRAARVLTVEPSSQESFGTWDFVSAIASTDVAKMGTLTFVCGFILNLLDAIFLNSEWFVVVFILGGLLQTVGLGIFSTSGYDLVRKGSFPQRHAHLWRATISFFGLLYILTALAIWFTAEVTWLSQFAATQVFAPVVFVVLVLPEMVMKLSKR